MRYTNKPMTTVGKASNVFKSVITDLLNGISFVDIKKPAGTPMRLAISVELILTLRETETISISAASNEAISLNADKRLSIRKLI